jgi:hypothetical protein
MITVMVNANREAIIQLMTLGPQEHQQEIEAADTEPLVGMSLLDGHTLRIDVMSGGVVAITGLS